MQGLDFARFDLPACSNCGGMLKPEVVFFGEDAPCGRVADVRCALAQSDAVLVVGSSLISCPALIDRPSLDLNLHQALS